MAIGVVRIARALSNVINFTITAHGFERIGVYCDLGDGEFGPSLTRVLQNCKTTVTRDEIKNIEEHMTEMCELFLRNGQLTEEDMDRMGIRRMIDSSDRRTADKDKRAQVYQRAMMLTAEASKTRRLRYLQDRANRLERRANRPTEEEKRLEAARKAEAKELSKNQKAEARQIEADRKAEAKQIEADRKAKEKELSKNQKEKDRQLEAVRKAKAKELNKNQKAEARQIEAARKVEAKQIEADRKVKDKQVDINEMATAKKIETYRAPEATSKGNDIAKEKRSIMKRAREIKETEDINALVNSCKKKRK